MPSINFIPSKVNTRVLVSVLIAIALIVGPNHAFRRAGEIRDDRSQFHGDWNTIGTDFWDHRECI